MGNVIISQYMSIVDIHAASTIINTLPMPSMLNMDFYNCISTYEFFTLHNIFHWFPATLKISSWDIGIQFEDGVSLKDLLLYSKCLCSFYALAASWWNLEKNMVHAIAENRCRNAKWKAGQPVPQPGFHNWIEIDTSDWLVDTFFDVVVVVMLLITN